MRSRKCVTFLKLGSNIGSTLCTRSTVPYMLTAGAISCAHGPAGAAPAMIIPYHVLGQTFPRKRVVPIELYRM
jgi:hypothetical protein